VTFGFLNYECVNCAASDGLNCLLGFSSPADVCLTLRSFVRHLMTPADGRFSSKVQVAMQLRGGSAWPELQSDESALRIAKISHDFAQRRRKLAHQSWYSDNLVARSQLRMFHQIDYFNSVASGQVLLA
jgi:hypothetical protein